MQDITWIFFDCFNTLVDDFDETGDQSGVKPLGELAAQAGVVEQPEDFHRLYIQWRKNEWDGTSWHEVNLPERIAGTLALGRSSSKPLSQLTDELMQCFHKTYPDTLRITPGAEEMLARVGHKYRTCLVSNFFLPGYPEKVLRQFDLHHSFDLIIDSAQVGFKKPGLEFYQYVFEQTGIGPEELPNVLFIGDSLVNDVVTPRKLGMQSLRFDRSRDVANFQPTPEGVPSINSWDQFLVDKK